MTHLAGINAEGAVLRQKTSRQFAATARVPPMKWDGYPNLRKRPPTPAKARGSIQRAIRRAFAASGAEALTSAQIYDWAYVRRRVGRCKTLPAGVYSRALRTLKVDPPFAADRADRQVNEYTP
jgi:hypothetical protein